MPSAYSKKGLDDGLITQKQYDKLPPHLLDAIVKKKRSGGGKKKKAGGKAPAKGGKKGKKGGKK